MCIVFPRTALPRGERGRPLNGSAELPLQPHLLADAATLRGKLAKASLREEGWVRGATLLFQLALGATAGGEQPIECAAGLSPNALKIIRGRAEGAREPGLQHVQPREGREQEPISLT